MAQTAKLFWSGRSQAVRLPKEFRLAGDEVRIRSKQGAAVILEPIATDWQWLDDIAGKFSEDFLQNGRNQPALPPGRDMGPAFERGNKPLDVRWLSCQCERHRSLGQAGCHGGEAHEHL